MVFILYLYSIYMVLTSYLKGFFLVNMKTCVSILKKLKKTKSSLNSYFFRISFFFLHDI